MNTRSTVLLALSMLVVACGDAQPVARSSPRAAAPVSVASPTIAPALPPSPQGTAPAPIPSTFTGVVVHAPGARVRYGPGLDLPVMDVDAVGAPETFDGWFRRVDDTPLPDEITGTVEPWSRDWLHLADGRGWMHSTAVRGRQPAGMPQRDWQPPNSVPDPGAGMIEVALHRQEHPVTCEIASLQMALAGRGIATDEASLLRLTGVDRRPAEAGADGIARWGDPNRTFVGDPDGRISTHTGYGVYAGPIARAAERSGASVIAAGTGIAPTAVYAAIRAGHPVIVWVPNDLRPVAVGRWRAWDGATIPYTLNEHAVLVVGATPASILINDPLGAQRWVARSTFEAAYATFDSMAVVIA